MLRVQPPGASPPALEIAVDQDGGDLLVDIRGLDRTGLARARLTHNGARLPLASFLAAGQRRVAAQIG